MIDGKTVLAIIPARGGSKGIPRKNIRMLAGKPLIAWTIDEAAKSKYIDRIILSSEDEEIMATAKEYGCEVPFRRPDELARDDTPGIEPVLHAIDTLAEKYDYVVLLQPTSPLRTSGDIDGCIQQCIMMKAPASVSVTEAKKHPNWMFKMNDNMKLIAFMQNHDVICCRQDLPKVYTLNGAVYVAETVFIKKTKSFLSDETAGYQMAERNSADIDDEMDFVFCEWLMSQER